MLKTSEYVARMPDRQGTIHYSEEENRIWHDLLARQMPKVKKLASNEYLDGLNRLDLPRFRIPQCAEISECLADHTGWRIEPVAALISFGEFFQMLSKRSFPAASFIRKRKHFDYIEEPDIFHEIYGHTPLLSDPGIARFTEAIGRAGLAANPADYAWLIRLYWFTIEFGLTRQSGGYKAFGSGLVSSPTELPYSVQSPVAQRHRFDVVTILRTPYRIDIQQPLYYVVENFDNLFEVVNRDMTKDIRQARKLGLLKPMFPPGHDPEVTRKVS